MASEGKGESEYAQNYLAWPLPKRIHVKSLPDAEIFEAPFLDITTHKADDAPKEILHKIRQTNNKSQDAPRPSHYTDAASEYGQRYQPEPIQPRIRPIKPDADAGCSVPFDGTSTQSADFQKWALKPRVLSNPTEVHKHLECPFTEKTTSYNLSYWDKSKHMHAKVKPNTPPPSCPVPFEGESIMRTDYAPKPITPKIRAPTPLSEYFDYAVSFDGETTYHDKFKEWELPPKMRVGVAKPNPEASRAKFSGETTYNTDFKKMQLPKRFPAPPRPHSSLN